MNALLKQVVTDTAPADTDVAAVISKMEHQGIKDEEAALLQGTELLQKNCGITPSHAFEIISGLVRALKNQIATAEAERDRLAALLAVANPGASVPAASVSTTTNAVTAAAAASGVPLTLSRSECSKCKQPRITEHVFDSSGTVVEVAVCANDTCESLWPVPVNVSNATALPPIPPTATCVAVTKLNSKAAAWIASSSNIRTVCIVGSAKVDTASQPLPQVQRVLFLNSWKSDSALLRDQAERFAAAFPNLLELCARYITNGSALAALAKCNLQSLILHKSDTITDAGLQHLRGLTALHSLDLGGCDQITDAGLQHLSGLTALQSLDLSGCDQISDAGLQHLRGLTALQSLNLNYCNKISDAGLQHLRALTALQSLTLCSCDKITDAGLQHLSGLTALQTLNLCLCSNITDSGLQHLSGLTALQWLSLGASHNYHSITDAGLQHLSGLTALRELHVASCSITDAGLKHLRGLTALQSLSFTSRWAIHITDVAKQALKRAIPGLEIK